MTCSASSRKSNFTCETYRESGCEKVREFRLRTKRPKYREFREMRKRRRRRNPRIGWEFGGDLNFGPFEGVPASGGFQFIGLGGVAAKRRRSTPAAALSWRCGHAASRV